MKDKRKEKIELLQAEITNENTPEWKKNQLESKLATYARKVATHKVWDSFRQGTYRKGKGEK